MSFGTPEMVISGKPHLVLLVSDRTPANLDDFVAADDFTVDMQGTSYRVSGSGRLVDDEVRFHEKDVDKRQRHPRVAGGPP